MATSQFAGQKRPTEEQVKTDPFLVDFNAFKETPTETKKDKTDDITERIRQLEEKYEKLQNSSRKLAESVVSGELSKEEAKDVNNPLISKRSLTKGVLLKLCAHFKLRR